MKFLRISTKLRERVDLRRISHEAMDRLLAEDGVALAEWIRNVEDLTSGQLVIHRESGQVSINGQCFGPGSASA